MAALYTIVTPIDGVDGPTFAVVADDTTAHYAYPDDAEPFMTNNRIADIATYTGTTPTTADAWLQLALTNLSYVKCSPVVVVNSLDDAIAAADQAMSSQT